MVEMIAVRQGFSAFRRPLSGILLAGVVAAACFGNLAKEPIQFTNALAIGSVGRSGRNPFHTDAIEKLLVTGHWRPPHDGEVIETATSATQTWHTVQADKGGVFAGRELRGGYLYKEVVLDAPEVWMLDAAGHSMVYVNGEPRPGDLYSNGILELPVSLRAGTNQFLFSAGRGRLKAQLTSPKAAAFISLRDNTLPDVILGEDEELWGAMVVVNAEARVANGLVISCSSDTETIRTPVPPVLPMSVRKVPFRVARFKELPAEREAGLKLKLISGDGQTLDEEPLALRIRKPTDHYKRTFRSAIDGSIQYYAVAPPNPLPKPGERLALFLSTHGASVEAMGQADAYASKSWGYLVAPTNRRPYGFDWEDWGREDALEVLNLTQTKFATDPAQTYLTGHSMGGHGAWQLGVTFPDRFAAVAPSAGWIRFWSYAGSERSSDPNPVEALLQRASTGSDTLALASNYLQHAIYILHGDADDNVPVTEARKMKERLSEFHHDLLYHEQPGAGHWWGNACVDWPPIFNLFAHHKIPANRALTEVRFSTANPGVSASNHWVTIEAQEHCLGRSSVDLSYDALGRKFTGTTENVARLAIATGEIASQPITFIELDGQKVEITEGSADGPVLRLWKRAGKWSLQGEIVPAAKGPARNGPFKEAFNHHMEFVYGTQGTAEENAWAYAKARYDAEVWWYRGNGAVDVIADTDFDSSSEPDRGIILYGNADNNAAWSALLKSSPVQVGRAAIKIGERELKGSDLACLLIRPRPGSETASVAAISGTGVAGLRLTDRVPYFLAGVAYPDCTVFDSSTLARGNAGVRVAGFFGNDWSVETGEFAWAE